MIISALLVALSSCTDTFDTYKGYVSAAAIRTQTCDTVDLFSYNDVYDTVTVSYKMFKYDSTGLSEEEKHITDSVLNIKNSHMTTINEQFKVYYCNSFILTINHKSYDMAIKTIGNSNRMNVIERMKSTFCSNVFSQDSTSNIRYNGYFGDTFETQQIISYVSNITPDSFHNLLLTQLSVATKP